MVKDKGAWYNQGECGRRIISPDMNCAEVTGYGKEKSGIGECMGIFEEDTITTHPVSGLVKIITTAIRGGMICAILF